MSKNDSTIAAEVFADPVTYLARFGITAELVPVEDLPLAA